jgi:hypothetical protein
MNLKHEEERFQGIRHGLMKVAEHFQAVNPEISRRTRKVSQDLLDIIYLIGVERQKSPEPIQECVGPSRLSIHVLDFYSQEGFLTELVLFPDGVARRRDKSDPGRNLIASGPRYKNVEEVLYHFGRKTPGHFNPNWTAVPRKSNT